MPTPRTEAVEASASGEHWSRRTDQTRATRSASGLRQQPAAAEGEGVSWEACDLAEPITVDGFLGDQNFNQVVH